MAITALSATAIMLAPCGPMIPEIARMLTDTRFALPNSLYYGLEATPAAPVAWPGIAAHRRADEEQRERMTPDDEATLRRRCMGIATPGSD